MEGESLLMILALPPLSWRGGSVGLRVAVEDSIEDAGSDAGEWFHCGC